MQLTIRPLLKKDIKQVSSFLSEMWFFHAENSSLINAKNLKKLNVNTYLKKIFKSKNQTAFVASLDNEIVGFVRCEIKKCPSFYYSKKEVYIDDLIVLEKFQKKGLAKKLINECILFAKKKKINLVTSKVYNFNKKSKALFEKKGFKEDYCFLSYKIKK